MGGWRMIYCVEHSVWNRCVEHRVCGYCLNTLFENTFSNTVLSNTVISSTSAVRFIHPRRSPRRCDEAQRAFELARRHRTHLCEQRLTPHLILAEAKKGRSFGHLMASSVSQRSQSGRHQRNIFLRFPKAATSNAVGAP